MIFALHLAFSCLTRLPLPPVDQYDERDFQKSFVFFPVVGMAVGIVLWIISLVLVSMGLHPAVVAFAVIALLVLATGALHLDGLADSTDGFFSGKPKDEILRIMKESRIGAFGVTVLVLVLIGKFAAVFSLIEAGRAHAIIAALALSRWGMVMASYNAPYPREDGTGKRFIGTVSEGNLWIATGVVILISLFTLGFWSIICLLLAAATAIAMKKKAQSKIGGVTGDVLGATNEMIELLMLIVV